MYDNDSDSTAGSCTCLTKTPEHRFHKVGCKYRLICERDSWKASHDNQVKLKSILMDRPDLGDRSRSMQNLIDERDALKLELENTRLATRSICSQMRKRDKTLPTLEEIRNWMAKQDEEIKGLRSMLRDFIS